MCASPISNPHPPQPAADPPDLDHTHPPPLHPQDRLPARPLAIAGDRASPARSLPPAYANLLTV